MASQGTTPRQLTDLIGSLCDLTSGSGDKGTPVVLVRDTSITTQREHSRPGQTDNSEKTEEKEIWK